MIQLFTLALRDLGRNRRRSFFSALAVGAGLMVLLLLAATIKGEYGSALASGIRLQTGHLQVRAKSYDENKTSLKYEDLIANPDQVAAQVAAIPGVKAATPRLFASGFVAIGNQSAGVRVFGIDPASAASDPYRTSVVSGQYFTADDSEGLLVGQTLADKFQLKAGDQVNLSVNTSNGDVAQQAFTVRGIYSTNTPGFDGGTILLPLAKAQTIAAAEKHASIIFVLLNDIAQTDRVAAALQSPAYQVLTYAQLNPLVLQTEQLANGYMVFLYLIVLGIAATVIINTLIMAVFERTREIGILAAIGMRSRSILGLFLAESSLLAVGGIILGLILGGLLLAYFVSHGFYVGNLGLSSGFLLGTTIYPQPTLTDTINLTIAAFVVTLLAGLYPAVLASRMEPVTALRGGGE
jgi:ABC-type lipoprotein release transport system permease subunit